MSRARHKREDGGRTHEWVSGNPDVEKEAEHEGEGGSKKHGGKVHKKHRRSGGPVTGSAVKARLDRKRGGTVSVHGNSGKHHGAGPIEAHMGTHHGNVMTGAKRPGRKRGGGVGADNTPLSTAHKGVAGAGTGSSSPGDTYGGLPED